VRRIASIVGCLLLGLVCTPAHHAFDAEYDGSALVSITGKLTRLTWTNPHAWLYVTGKDGPWRFEMGAPGGLLSRGWKRGDLRTGDTITIDGYRAKNGHAVANARIVTLPDGRKLFGGFQSTPREPVAPKR